MPPGPTFLEALNALALLGLAGVLAAAYGFQFALGELPCPLCMLQRVAFATVAFGFLLNVRYGSRAKHYGIVILGALFGMAVSGRQAMLHVVPGTGAYGSAVLGLHFYSWAFVLFATAALATAGMLIAQPPERESAACDHGVLSRVAGWSAIVVTLANAVTTLLQCGPIECGDNPVRYWISTLFS